ncbi:MAG TPA: hypothetical protein PKI62_12690 [bacterium]|nr:hypothetical protein [bacterium]HPR89146.1 hypothetical protein [bacterium]
MKLRRTLALLLLGALLLPLLAGCKNPLSDKKNKKLVHEEIFYGMGRYVYFWNGKDLDDKYVTPGKYYVVLEVKDFQDQDYVTAIKGGEESGRESGFYYYNEIWLTNELGKIEPNPFKIEEGCTITFVLNNDATSKLLIYQD